MIFLPAWGLPDTVFNLSFFFCCCCCCCSIFLDFHQVVQHRGPLQLIFTKVLTNPAQYELEAGSGKLIFHANSARSTNNAQKRKLRDGCRAYLAKMPFSIFLYALIDLFMRRSLVKTVSKNSTGKLSKSAFD